MRFKRRGVRGAEGDLGLLTMGCVVLDVDILGPHSSAHLCWAYEADGHLTGFQREACCQSAHLVHLRL